MKMIIILQDQAGFKKQFDIDTPFVIKNAIFSDMILDDKVNERVHSFSLSAKSPNAAIEKQYYKDLKEEKQYYKDLRECLKKKNAAYCNSKIMPPWS